MINPQITPFSYSGQQVRTVELNGAIALVLSDIAKVLGYRDANTAGRILRDHHKGYAEVRTPGGTQQMTVVTEQGFNRLVMRSNATNAENVQDWVTDEVLPQIRKTGSYSVPRSLEQRSLEVIAELSALVTDQRAELDSARPKAAAWESVVSSAGSWSYNDAAKVLCDEGEIRIGEKRLVNELITWGHLYRDRKGRPHVYQRFLEQGLYVAKARTYRDHITGEIKESSAPQVRITGKGLDMIRTRLLNGVQLRVVV